MSKALRELRVLGLTLGEDDLAALRAAWAEAEGRLKRTEHLRLAVAVPAVNELRYAGYHLLEALSTADRAVTSECLVRALRHCQRATYDSVEAEVLLYFEDLKRFQADYRTILIQIPGVDYVAIRTQAREARDLILQARKQDDTRSEYYKKLISYCDSLKFAVTQLEEARVELNKLLIEREERQQEKVAAAEREKSKALEENARERNKTRQWRISTAVALVAALGALAKIYIDRPGASVSAHPQLSPSSSPP